MKAVVGSRLGVAAEADTSSKTTKWYEKSEFIQQIFISIWLMFSWNKTKIAERCYRILYPMNLWDLFFSFSPFILEFEFSGMLILGGIQGIGNWMNSCRKTSNPIVRFMNGMTYSVCVPLYAPISRMNIKWDFW